MKEKVISYLKGITAVCLILGIIFIGMGFHKRYVYESNEHSWSTPKNAYVGGDAYNYIINGTYFTGYSVIGMGCFIVSAITGSQAAVIMCISKQEKAESSILNEEPI